MLNKILGDNATMTRLETGTYKKNTANAAAAVNMAMIVSALRKHPRWLELMKALAGRQRIHSTSTFVRVRRDIHEKKGNSKWTFDEIGEVFKMLQSAGAGELHLYGDKDPEFHWNFYYRDVVMTAIKSAQSDKAPREVATPELRPANLRPNKPLPRMTSPTEPVLSALAAPAAYNDAPAVATTNGDSGSILIQLRGMEFELELSKVPAELLKFRRML